MMDRFGLAMGSFQAGEMLADISKYLYFASHGEESIHDLYNMHKVKSYFLKLEDDVISCSGQLAKLQRIETALRLAKVSKKWTEM